MKRKTTVVSALLVAGLLIGALYLNCPHPALSMSIVMPQPVTPVSRAAVVDHCQVFSALVPASLGSVFRLLAPNRPDKPKHSKMVGGANVSKEQLVKPANVAKPLRRLRPVLKPKTAPVVSVEPGSELCPAQPKFLPSALRKPLGEKSPVAAKKKSRKKIIDLARIITGLRPLPAKDPEGEQPKLVALTFDDGPDPTYTPKVLSILKKNGIKATFCLVGRQVKKYPELVRQIVAEGHKVASHTMNHDERLPVRSDKKLREEILGCKELIEAAAPEAKVEFFRAPGGNWNRHMRDLALAWGMRPLGWSVDTKDWQHPGSDVMLDTVDKQLRPGGIILMHDAGGDRSESVQALEDLIPVLEEEGYEFAQP
jgi:peptidoglycan/xylan/chitin deacetylase (PgdA/CDA1 family)